MNLEEYILTKIAEEAAKVAECALAAAQFGPTATPANKEKNNVQALETKLNDLLGVLKLCRTLGVSQLPDLGKVTDIDDKQRRVLKFMTIPLLNGRLELTADQINSMQRVSKELGLFHTD